MMKKFIVLLRGINVGGRNKIAMADLRSHLEELGFSEVLTYIASGNVLLQSEDDQAKIQAKIEEALPKKFTLDSQLVKVLALPISQLESIVKRKPNGFGEEPHKYHSDVIFLMDYSVPQAMTAFDPKAGVDKIWPGERVIYSQRLSELRTKSRLNKVLGTLAYQHMTIRNWNTVTKLLNLASQ